VFTFQSVKLLTELVIRGEEHNRQAIIEQVKQIHSEHLGCRGFTFGCAQRLGDSDAHDRPLHPRFRPDQAGRRPEVTGDGDGVPRRAAPRAGLP
jgi:hypothetical protein